MIINHNLGAMNANRNMAINASNASKSMEKLSSGLRINKAGDDAAGLAISEKMRGQIRGLDQAGANAQDAISLTQTAEGALNETHSILQRMRELSVQSAGDTNTAADRGNIQQEFDQLAKEVTRIANTTQFNTQNLLNGSMETGRSGAAGADTFQIGANNGQNITLSVKAMDAESLGISRTAKTGTIGTTNTANAASVEADNGIDTKLAEGSYTVTVANIAAGATSATETSATGTITGAAVSGTATKDTNVTLMYSTGEGIPTATKAVGNSVTVAADAVSGTATALTNVTLTRTAGGTTATTGAAAVGGTTAVGAAGVGNVVIKIDGTTITTAVANDDTSAIVVGKINIAANLAMGTSSVLYASNDVLNGGKLTIKSFTAGASSSVDVTAGTGTATADLGLVVVVGASGIAGTAATAGKIVGATVTAPTTVKAISTGQLNITIDGTAHAMNIVTADIGVGKSNVDLLARINGSLTGFGSASIVDGKLQIKSATTGTASKVSISYSGDAADITALKLATGLAGTEIATAGTAGVSTWEAEGDVEGTIANSGVVELANGVSIDMSKLTGSANDDVVTIAAAIVPGWTASGDKNGAISGATNAINGMNINIDTLFGFANGETVTITGDKEASATAQLSINRAAEATYATNTGTVAIGNDFLSGAAAVDTSVVLTRTDLGTKGTDTVGSAAATNTVTTGGVLNLKIDGIEVNTATIANGAAKAVVVAAINTAANSALHTTGKTYASLDADTGKLRIESLTTGVLSKTEVVGATGTILTDLNLGVAAGDAGVATGGVKAWVATGTQITGTRTMADAGVASFGTTGVSADMSKLTGAAVGDTVTITGKLLASSTDIGSALTIDKANGGTYSVGDTTTGELNVTFAAGAATAGTISATVADNASLAATFANGQKQTDAVVTGGVDVSTQKAASIAITKITAAMATVSTERSKLGAFSNRLEHTIANLGTSSENLTSAESRIRDVDMAKEMSNFSKNNILSQAAQAMLAQANQQPQQVLQLLR